MSSTIIKDGLSLPSRNKGYLHDERPQCLGPDITALSTPIVDLAKNPEPRLSAHIFAGLRQRNQAAIRAVFTVVSATRSYRYVVRLVLEKHVENNV